MHKLKHRFNKVNYTTRNKFHFDFRQKRELRFKLYMKKRNTRVWHPNKIHFSIQQSNVTLFISGAKPNTGKYMLHYPYYQQTIVDALPGNPKSISAECIKIKNQKFISYLNHSSSIIADRSSILYIHLLHYQKILTKSFKKLTLSYYPYASRDG